MISLPTVFGPSLTMTCTYPLLVMIRSILFNMSLSISKIIFLFVKSLFGVTSATGIDSCLLMIMCSFHNIVSLMSSCSLVSLLEIDEVEAMSGMLLVPQDLKIMQEGLLLGAVFFDGTPLV